MRTDFLVIGSGVAGMFCAYKLSRYGEVTIITKEFDYESNTYYAQGGVASVFSSTDDPEIHLKDTLEAGAGLCDIEATRILVQEGPGCVKELLELGVPFNKDSEGNLDLGLEGGHRKKRIVHAYDRTGREIELTLLTVIKANSNIKLLEHHNCVDLITGHHLKNNTDSDITCYGAYVLNTKKGEVLPILAKKTILATGGAGQTYLHTTNPTIATGDGVACAFRAGAVVKNMEFYQFHPTSLYHKDGDSFLISEAVRGKGGILRRPNGEAFMSEYHSMKDLAPRDIVARAIDNELKKGGWPNVFLDVTHITKPEIMQNFPSIYSRCKSLGIDITEEPIPVVPAAHYMCGGVTTDVQGRTNIRNLFASGEVASTGVHGGNRLASNSLLEGLVFSTRIASFIGKSDDNIFQKQHDEIPEWNKEGVKNTEEWVLISHDLKEIKTIMNDYVGIVRSNLRLERALRRIELIGKEVVDYYNRTTVTGPLLDLRNLALVAELIIRSAMMRKESRGLHYSTDYREDRSPSRQDTILQNLLNR